MKGWTVALGLGMAAGAVAVLALPKNCTARMMAAEAAQKVEDTVNQVANKIVDEVTG